MSEYECDAAPLVADCCPEVESVGEMGGSGGGGVTAVLMGGTGVAVVLTGGVESLLMVGAGS